MKKGAELLLASDVVFGRGRLPIEPIQRFDDSIADILGRVWGTSSRPHAIVIDPINPPGEGKASVTGLAYGVDRGDRVGHYLRDDLLFDLNGTGTTPSPKYRLHVSTTQGTVTPTIETQESLATSAVTAINATYQLLPYAGGTMHWPRRSGESRRTGKGV